MQIVQSFWSKPSSNDQGTGSNLRNTGGWPELRYFYYAWALSSLKFREYFKDVVLFTDKEGKCVLVDQLQLPYTKVFVELDQLNRYSPKLWAIGKLYAYSRQTAPFIHADGDFIPFRKFSKQCLQANLLVQSKECGLDKFYLSILTSVKSSFRDIPDEIRNPVTKETESANLGIVGGHHIEFFRNYSRTALDFIDKNVDRFDTVQVGEFNCVAEQYLFYQMAKKRNLDVKFLLSSVSPSFAELIRFHMIPNLSSYIHIIGTYKQDATVLWSLERTLRRFYPTIYNRINSLVNFSSDTCAMDFSKERYLEAIRKTSIHTLRFRLSRKYDIQYKQSHNSTVILQYADKKTNITQEITMQEIHRDILEFNRERSNSLSQILDFVASKYMIKSNKIKMRESILSFLLNQWYSRDILEISMK